MTKGLAKQRATILEGMMRRLRGKAQHRMLGAVMVSGGDHWSKEVIRRLEQQHIDHMVFHNQK